MTVLRVTLDTLGNGWQAVTARLMNLVVRSNAHIGWRLMAFMLGLTALGESWMHIVGEYDERRFQVYQEVYGYRWVPWTIAYFTSAIILLLPDYLQNKPRYVHIIGILQHIAMLTTAFWVLGLHVFTLVGEHRFQVTAESLPFLPWPIYVIMATLRASVFGRSRDAEGNFRIGMHSRSDDVP